MSEKPQMYQEQTVNVNVFQTNRRFSFGLASFIIGMISLFLTPCVFIPILGCFLYFFPILGVIFACVGIYKYYNEGTDLGWSIAGFVLSAIPIVIGFFVYAMMFISLVPQ